MVAFGDVNLSEEPIREYGAGQGGWPTIRYFNKETGYNGQAYTQKTSGAICDELGQDSYMQAYVEEYGSTSLCSLADDFSGCSEKEVAFATKWKEEPGDAVLAQLKRLQGMAGNSMKPELKKWLGQRVSMLSQIASGLPKEEL